MTNAPNIKASKVEKEHNTLLPPAIGYEPGYSQKGMKKYRLKYIWDEDKTKTKESYDKDGNLTGTEKTIVKKTKSLEQKIRIIKGKNPKEILDGI